MAWSPLPPDPADVHPVPVAEVLPDIVAYLDVNARQAELRSLNYREEYLRSPHWRLTRKAALGRARYQCSSCGATRRLQVHHLTYQRLGRERDEDLRVLCEDCHHQEHEEAKWAG